MHYDISKFFHGFNNEVVPPRPSFVEEGEDALSVDNEHSREEDSFSFDTGFSKIEDKSLNFPSVSNSTPITQKSVMKSVKSLPDFHQNSKCENEVGKNFARDLPEPCFEVDNFCSSVEDGATVSDSSFLKHETFGTKEFLSSSPKSVMLEKDTASNLNSGAIDLSTIECSDEKLPSLTADCTEVSNMREWRLPKQSSTDFFDGQISCDKKEKTVAKELNSPQKSVPRSFSFESFTSSDVNALNLPGGVSGTSNVSNLTQAWQDLKLESSLVDKEQVLLDKNVTLRKITPTSSCSVNDSEAKVSEINDSTKTSQGLKIETSSVGNSQIFRDTKPASDKVKSVSSLRPNSIDIGTSYNDNLLDLSVNDRENIFVSRIIAGCLETVSTILEVLSDTEVQKVISDMFNLDLVIMLANSRCSNVRAAAVKVIFFCYY